MSQPLRTPRALTLLLATGLVACGAGSMNGSGQDASARSVPSPLFAAYVIAGGTEPVGLPAGDRVATQTKLGSVAGVAVGDDGAVLVADRAAHSVRRIDMDGQMITVAGTGRPGFAGDAGPGSSAELRRPTAVAVQRNGSVLFADTGNHRIRRVSPSGTIRTVAGCGRRALAGDGGPAARACLNAPRGVAALSDGGFLIADSGNHRIRRVTAQGAISTVAGRAAGFSGDGRSARRARLRAPQGVATLAGGGFIVADTGNRRVRKISARGTITTVAGGGRREPEGAPATRAFLGRPVSVARDPRGSILIADEGNAGFAVFSALYRLTPRGTLRAVVTSEGARRLLGAVRPAQPVGVASSPDGSIVVSERREDRLLLLAPQKSARLAVRFAPRFLGIDEGAPLTTTVLATQRSGVEFQVLRDGVAVARGRFTVPPGRSAHTLLERADEGRYRVELVARDGARVTTDVLDVGVSGDVRYVESLTGP